MSKCPGSEVHVHCAVNKKEVVLIVAAVGKDGGHFHPPEVRKQIFVGFSSKLCHLFGENEQNLEL